MPTTTELPGVAELLDAAVGAVGGQRREGQDQMADAVRAAIATREHVPAGRTGTGRPGLPVPAIHHAVPPAAPW